MFAGNAPVDRDGCLLAVPAVAESLGVFLGFDERAVELRFLLDRFAFTGLLPRIRFRPPCRQGLGGEQHASGLVLALCFGGLELAEDGEYGGVE